MVNVMHGRKRKTLVFILFWAILIASFVFFTFLIVLKAQGWQLNWKVWKLVKTGMIVLDGEPSDSSVKVNDKTLKSTLPIRLSKLSPGNYEVIISHEGYLAWQNTIKVSPGKASVYQNIILFLETPQDSTPLDNLTQEKIIAEAKGNSQDVKIAGSEIFYRGNFLTRFSQDLLGAYLYPDQQHLVFQIENEIRVIDIDGSNNHLLFTLEKAEITPIIFRNNGRQVLYFEDGKIKAKIIR